jgi:hypothetical protein
LGFGAIGLLIFLVLIGIGVLIFLQLRSPSSSDLAQETPLAEAPTQAVAVVTDPPAPTVLPAEASTPTDEPAATSAAQDRISAPEVEAPEINTPEVEIPETNTPAVEAPVQTAAASLTGQEVADLALVAAQNWQTDAVLREISTSGLGPLDAEGKSTDWILKFWSPSSKGLNTSMRVNGTFTSSPTDLPTPKTTILEGVILDTKRLYDIAEGAGAAEYTAQGYRPMAAITPYPLDEARLTWYLNFAGGDFRVVYTVIIDAKTGEVIQAIPTE